MAENDIVLNIEIGASTIERVVDKVENDGKRIGASVKSVSEAAVSAGNRALEKLTQIGPAAEKAIGDSGATKTVKKLELEIQKMRSQLELFAQQSMAAAEVASTKLAEATAKTAAALKNQAAATNAVADAQSKVAKVRGPDGRFLPMATEVTPPGAPPSGVPAAGAAAAALGANMKEFAPDAELGAKALEEFGKAAAEAGKETDEADAAKKRFHQNILEAIPDFDHFGLSMEKIGELANHAFVTEFHAAAQGGENLEKSISSALNGMKGSIAQSEDDIKALGEQITRASGESEVFGQTFARVWTQSLDPYQAFTAARKADADETQRIVALRAEEAAATAELATVVDGFVEHLQAMAEAKARLAQQEEFLGNQADAALRGRLDRESAAQNTLVQMRERAAQQHLDSINPAVAGQQAFNQTLGATNSLLLAYGARATAVSETQGRLTAEIMATGKAMGFTATQMEALRKRVEAGINPMIALDNVARRVKDGFERTDSALKRVGMTFTALFVVDRAKQAFEGLLGAIVKLAVEGATYQFQQQSLLVTAKRLGENTEDVGKALTVLTANFVDSGTAVQALRTVLNTGIGLPRAVQLLKVFEEASLRGNMATKGLTDRVLAGAQALQDRSSRAMGNNTTLQMNYGQALKLTNEVLDKQIGATVRVATTQTLAGESLKWFTGLMREASLTAGILNIATNTVVGQLALFDKNVKQLRITAGAILAPVLGAFLKILNDLIPKIAEFVAVNAEMFRTFMLGTAIVAGLSAAITGLTVAIVSAIALISFLTPLGVALLVLNGIAVAMIGLTTAVRGPRQALLDLAAAGSFMLNVLIMLPEVFKRVGYEFDKFGDNVRRSVEAFSGRAKIFLDIAVTVVSIIFDFLRGAQANLIVATVNMVDRIKQKLKELRMSDAERDQQAKRELEIEESTKKHMARYHNIVIDAQRAVVNERDNLQKQADDLANRPPSLANTNLINSTNERLAILTETLADLEKRGLSMDDILKGAGAKSAEFVKYLDKLLDFNKNFQVGVDVAKPNPLLDKIGEDASNAAMLVEAARNRMRQAINQIKDSFMGVVNTLSGQVSDTFLGDGFTKKLDDFDRRFAESTRKFKSQLSSKELRLDGLEASLEKLKLTDMFPQKELDDAREILVQMRAMEQTAEDTQSVVRGFFVRKAFDEELQSMKDFQTLRLRSMDFVGEADARLVARGFALRLKALDTFSAITVQDNKEIARLRVDIEKEADVQIATARSRQFRFIAENIRMVSGMVQSEINKLFDFTAMRAQEIEEFSKQMQRDLSISEAELQQQQMIDSINKTSKTEQERQMRILATEAATSRKIKAIQEGTAKDSANLWIRVFDALATNIAQTLVDRVMTQAIEGKLIPAIAKLFGGAGGILGTANVEVDLGTTIQDSLMRMGDLSEIFKSEMADEKAILNDMLTALNAIEQSVNAGATDLQQRGLLQTRQPNFIGPPQPGLEPGSPGFIGPVGGAPFGGGDTDKKKEAQSTGEVGDKMFHLSKTLDKVSLGMAAFGALNNLFGNQLPPSIKTLMKAVTAVTLVLDVLKVLGVIHEGVKQAEIATDTLAIAFTDKMAFSAFAASIALDALAASAFIGAVVPAVASGGVVNGPITALVGEAGPEMILPLSGDVLGRLAGQLVMEQRRSEPSQQQGSSSLNGGRSLNLTIPITVAEGDEALARRLERRIRGLVDEEVGSSIKRRTLGMGSIG